MTVSGSGVSIDSIEAKKPLSLLVESLAPKRSNENLTSFEEKGSPSWNLTFGLRVKVRVFRSGEKVHFSASCGVTEKSSLIFVRPSKMLSCVISPIAAAGAVVGSSPGGSSTMPIVTPSFAEARPTQVTRAKVAETRKRLARRMRRSGNKRPGSIASRDGEASRMKNPLVSGQRGLTFRPNRKKRRSARLAAAVGRSGATLGHEPLELLAVLGATDRLDIFGEFALRVVELATLLIETGELGSPPFVESHVAGRGRIETAPAPHGAAAPGRR